MAKKEPGGRAQLLAPVEDSPSAAPPRTALQELPPDAVAELEQHSRRMVVAEEIFARLAKEGIGQGFNAFDHHRVVAYLDVDERGFLESLGMDSRRILKEVARHRAILSWQAQCPPAQERQQAIEVRDAAIARRKREAPQLEEQIAALQRQLNQLHQAEATAIHAVEKHAEAVKALRSLAPEFVLKRVSHVRATIKERFAIAEIDSEINFSNGVRVLISGPADEGQALLCCRARWPELISEDREESVSHRQGPGQRSYTDVRVTQSVNWPSFVAHVRRYLQQEVPALEARRAAALAAMEAALVGYDEMLTKYIP